MTPDPADRAKALTLTPVSRETESRLDRFVTHLLSVQEHTNLIAPSTIPTLWTRHIADSLQLLPLAPDARTWIDLGSGGGFPGLVLAAALAEKADTRVDLVESVAKKATFLSDAARLMDVTAHVHPVRIEDFGKNPSAPADVVTARALAPLKKLFDLVYPLMQGETKALLMKGQDVEAELTEAATSWNIEADLKPSLTHPAGRIVIVHRLRRRGRNSRS